MSDEAYGRVTNPERFAPLVTAAKEFADDVATRFDVDVTRVAGDAGSQVVEAVHFVPAQDDQAPLIVSFTSFPGVLLDVGASQRIALPACGCDACEEDVENLIGHLNRYLSALVSGQFYERIVDSMVEHVWEGGNWRNSGRGPIPELRVAMPEDGRWKRWSPK
ncbi:hypothetical protein CH289_05990 [Rhodococcus sp. RS1C4]|uniref:DUF6226 family protein n=1 Tax=Rhodococcoides fascians TaxID=1828 RepID=UPI00055E29C4|nr:MULTISPECIES: DUF6226 family protein [Rhodococcus]OZC56268.1 hypothetical protein CH289_05990 [Rhodococcus sp. RS1C4]OZC78407.1 hypothetical protein CH282_21815 [Rhodococcus sp. 06-418-1B]